jgi:hypothetical protein
VQPYRLLSSDFLPSWCKATWLSVETNSFPLNVIDAANNIDHYNDPETNDIVIDYVYNDCYNIFSRSANNNFNYSGPTDVNFNIDFDFNVNNNHDACSNW